MSSSIAALLVEAAERFLGEALEQLDAAGYRWLSVSHAFAVQLIEAGVNTITALSRAMRMTPQAVSTIVNELEKRGCVARRRRESDARAKVITLTDDGRRLATAIASVLASAEGRWAELVGDRRLMDVRVALSAYVADGAGPAGPPARRRQRRVRIV